MAERWPEMTLYRWPGARDRTAGWPTSHAQRTTNPNSPQMETEQYLPATRFDDLQAELEQEVGTWRKDAAAEQHAAENLKTPAWVKEHERKAEESTEIADRLQAILDRSKGESVIRRIREEMEG